MEKRPTIQDVAQKAGVSAATVSAVINGRSTVKSTTRSHVLNVIQEMDYHPTRSAQKPRLNGIGTRQKVRSIGLIVKEIDNPFYANIQLGVRDYADQQGCPLLIASSERDCHKERELVSAFWSAPVDGLIISPVLDEQTDLWHLFEMKRTNFPFVLLKDIQWVQANVVTTDNVEASKQAVKYLIDCGHTQIVHFAGPGYTTHSEDRLMGVRQAFSESHLAFSQDMVVPAGDSLEEGYRAGLAFFRQQGEKSRPTAVTCFNDLVALGLLRALDELGLRVPDDVSVIGYDDIPMVEYLPVPLTTISNPGRQIGEQAAELLFKLVDAPATLPPEKIFLQAPLLKRQSTRSLKMRRVEAAGS